MYSPEDIGVDGAELEVANGLTGLVTPRKPVEVWLKFNPAVSETNAGALWNGLKAKALLLVLLAAPSAADDPAAAVDAIPKPKGI